LGQRSGSAAPKTVHGNDFLVFNQQFNTLIKAGIPILKALDLLPNGPPRHGFDPSSARSGAWFAKAPPCPKRSSSRSLSQGVHYLVLAGEKSGNLSGVLEYYIAYQRVTTGLRKKLIATLIYPTILVCAATLIVTYLVTTVIPKFALLYGRFEHKSTGGNTHIAGDHSYLPPVLAGRNRNHGSSCVGGVRVVPVR